MDEKMATDFVPSGRRRALLIGINYTGMNSLRGCVRDVAFMAHLLRTTFDFSEAEFLVMTDKPHGVQDVRSGRPTRKGILSGLRWLVSGARKGDSLFLHFSGHGSQVVDTSGDEADGFDETLLPMDFDTAGHIVDDEIHSILVRGIPPGVRLTALMDCSHSGTIMDLPLVYEAGAVEPYLERPITDNVIDCGEVVLFSSCRDNELKADTKRLAGVVTGALTYSLVEALESSSVKNWKDHTYRSLFQAMVSKLTKAGVKQLPQLSTSSPFNIDSPFKI